MAKYLQQVTLTLTFQREVERESLDAVLEDLSEFETELVDYMILDKLEDIRINGIIMDNPEAGGTVTLFDHSSEAIAMVAPDEPLEEPEQEDETPEIAELLALRREYQETENHEGVNSIDEAIKLVRAVQTRKE